MAISEAERPAPPVGPVPPVGPAPPVGSVSLGDLDRTEPISRVFGGDRGTPLDRHYIDAFLSAHAADIRGRVLEIGEDLYTKRHGGDRVSHSDILDMPDSDNRQATILADLTSCPEIPGGQFDCIILTQTLHMIYEIRAALGEVHRLLAPGGVLLATLPGISQIDTGSGEQSWFWYLTPQCCERFFGEAFGAAVTVTPHGNVLAAIAFLHGLALEEMDTARLDRLDVHYPVITGVRCVKG